MNRIRANFRDCIVENNYMWVFDNVLQAVCRINQETMTMDIVQRYEGDTEITVGWIILYQNKLYMIDAEKTGILIFDRNKKCFYERFDVPKTGTGKPGTSSVFVYENTLWIFPKWSDGAVCCYDLKKGKFFIDEKITGRLRESKTNMELFSNFFCRENNYLWMVCCGRNLYWKYDLKTGTYETYELEDSNAELSGIFCKDGKKWLSFYDAGKVMCVDAEENCEIWDDSDTNRFPFSNICENGKYIIYLPCCADGILIIDTENRNMQKINLCKGIIRTSFMLNRMRNACEYEGCMYMLPWNGEDMYKIDNITGEVEQVTVMASFNYELEQIRGRIKKEEILMENKDSSLKGFLDYCSELI